MALTKPLVDSATWGNTNTTSPDMVTPGAGLVNTGFLAPPTLPKRGHMNWLLNKLHQGLRYYLAQGVPAWDGSETNYAVGSVVMYSGLGYVLNVASPAGTNPATDTAHWGLLVPLQPGTVLRTTFIATTASPASIAGCKRARAWLLAGGGAGGGTPGTLTAGGGGSAGGTAYFETTVIPANWVTVIGAGGTGVAGANGNAGGNTTFTDGATLVTAFGGPGGKTNGDPGAAPAISTFGTINGSGQAGFAGIASVAGSISGVSGAGGSSDLMGIVGGGGASVIDHTSSANGNAGTGPGAGGGGSMSNGTISLTGGNGTAGGIFLVEYA